MGLSVPLVRVKSTEVHLRWELTHGIHSQGPAQGESLPVFFSRVDAQEDLLQRVRLKAPEDEHGVAHAFFEPGTYRLKSRPAGKIYVARATSGGTDLLREDLVVDAGSAPAAIEIVLRDDRAKIDGKVAGATSLEEGRVIAVPEDSIKQGISTGVAADGSFHFGDLAPGRYSIVALQNADTLDLDDAQSAARVERMGDVTEVQADTTVAVKLQWKRWDQ